MCFTYLGTKKKHAGVVNMGQQIQGFAVLLRAVVLLQPFWLEAPKFVTAWLPDGNQLEDL